MLQINPKKFKSIQNKTIPSPMRPKFRNSNETNIYFYSKRKVENEKKNKIFKDDHVLIIHREKGSNENFNNIFNELIIKYYGRSKIIFGKFF